MYSSILYHVVIHDEMKISSPIIHFKERQLDQLFKFMKDEVERFYYTCVFCKSIHSESEAK